MSPHKATCSRCLELKAECVCLEPYDDPFFAITQPARHCRHCDGEIARGPRGWHDADDPGLAGYGCPDAPLGWHET